MDNPHWTTFGLLPQGGKNEMIVVLVLVVAQPYQAIPHRILVITTFVKQVQLDVIPWEDCFILMIPFGMERIVVKDTAVSVHYTIHHGSQQTSLTQRLTTSKWESAILGITTITEASELNWSNSMLNSWWCIKAEVASYLSLHTKIIDMAVYKYKYKKQLNKKLKNKVEMRVSKSTQTRFVIRIIMYRIHPYAWFSRKQCVAMCMIPTLIYNVMQEYSCWHGMTMIIIIPSYTRFLSFHCTRSTCII